MKDMPKRLVFTLLFIGCMGKATAQEKRELDPRIRQVLADWKQRQNKATTVRYSWRGSILYPKEVVAEAMPQTRKRTVSVGAPRAVSLAHNGALIIHFPTNRYRLELDEETINFSTLKGTRTQKTATFDGKSTWGGNLRMWVNGEEKKNTPDPSDVLVRSGNLSNVPMNRALLPLFLGHGIVTIGPFDEILPGKMFFEPDTTGLQVHGEGIHDGRACLVLRTVVNNANNRAATEFWIDTDRNSNVVRVVRMIDDLALEDLEVRYQSTKAGWLVRGWTATRLGTSGGNDHYSIIRKWDIQDLAIDLPVQDSDFKLEINPGMLVRRIEQKGSRELFEMGSEKKGQLPAGDYFRVDEKGNEKVVSSTILPDEKGSGIASRAAIVAAVLLALPLVFWSCWKVR